MYNCLSTFINDVSFDTLWKQLTSTSAISEGAPILDVEFLKILKAKYKSDADEFFYIQNIMLAHILIGKAYMPNLYKPIQERYVGWLCELNLEGASMTESVTTSLAIIRAKLHQKMHKIPDFRGIENASMCYARLLELYQIRAKDLLGWVVPAAGLYKKDIMLALGLSAIAGDKKDLRFLIPADDPMLLADMSNMMKTIILEGWDFYANSSLEYMKSTFYEPLPDDLKHVFDSLNSPLYLHHLGTLVAAEGYDTRKLKPHVLRKLLLDMTKEQVDFTRYKKLSQTNPVVSEYTKSDEYFHKKYFFDLCAARNIDPYRELEVYHGVTDNIVLPTDNVVAFWERAYKQLASKKKSERR